MGQRLLIDASVLVAAERGRFDLRAHLASQPEIECSLASITVAEILHGWHRAQPEHKVRREAFIQRLLAEFPVLAFDLEAARAHARLGAGLAESGILIGAHDLILGATAVSRNAGVATRDLRSFPRIPGLEVARW
jgi:tRNA(fMet)-specific endonuclease VapC